MSRLIFIVAEKKINDWNLEFDVRIDPIDNAYGDLDQEQHEVFIPDKWRIEEVDWGDGVINSEKIHKYASIGVFRVKAKVIKSHTVFNVESNNIIKFYKIPGILDSPAVNNVIPNKFILTQNKIPPGGLIPLIDAILSKYPTTVEPLSYIEDKFIFNANGQVGHLSRTRINGKSRGQTYNPQALIYLDDASLLASRRTQEELDKGWELVNKGWRVEMAVDNIYTVTMPKSVDDYLADEQGNQKHGYRNVAVFPIFDESTNTLYGRAMKLMQHQYGSYARDERDSRSDGRQNRRSTLVPQKLYVYWQFQKPGETTWGHEIPIELNPVPASGDEKTSIPAGMFTGTYKLATPVVLDRNQFPSGTKVRSMWHQKWLTYAPEKGINPRLRITEGLPDDQSLILTLP